MKKENQICECGHKKSYHYNGGCWCWNDEKRCKCKKFKLKK